MKKFTFKVTRVENYEAKIEIEAESEQTAREILDVELHQDPIHCKKNTYTGALEAVELIQSGNSFFTHGSEHILIQSI